VTGSTRRVAAGAAWLYLQRWLDRLLEFAAIVVLARILSPADFGLVAVAASMVTIVEGVTALGVEKALIRSRGDDARLYDTAWTLSVLRGLLVAAVMLAIALALDDPRVAAIVRVLSIVPIFNGLANPMFVRFERDLIYSRLAMLTLGAKVASVTATIAAAFAWRNAWALVAGLLINSLASSVLSYALRPYRPRFSLARLSELFGFTGWLTLTSAVTALSMETDRIIVAWLLGITNAGLYDMTQRVAVMPTRELLSPFQRLLLPAFSQLIDDAPRLRSAVSESINVLASLGLPAAFGFALVAGDLVPLALGPQWQPIVGLLAVLVPFLGLRATLSMTLPFVLALGETRMLFNVSLIYALLHVPVFTAGTAMFGLAGAVWGIVAAGVLYIYLNAWMLQRTLAIRPGEIARQLRRPVAATAVMCLGVAALAGVSGLDFMPAVATWRSFAIKAGVGAAIFCASQYAMWRLEGRPAGIERRLVQLASRQAPG